MSMTFYSGNIKVFTVPGRSFSFSYEFDNEIRPDIIVPENWKELCADRDSIVDLFDNFLGDSSLPNYSGLKNLIDDFDECLPEDMASGPEYGEFLEQVSESCGQIKRIEISVVNDDDDSVEDSRVLEL